MNQSIYFETVNDYNEFNNHETLHPLVSVIDFSKAQERTGSKMFFNLYCIFLKDVKCGDLKYGRATYDYQQGTLVFISPGQVVDVENKIDIYQPLGYGLVFHPDLIKGTSLTKSISEYAFFGYQTNEALHLSKKEQQMVLEMFANIQFELSRPVDKHSKKETGKTAQEYIQNKIIDVAKDRVFNTDKSIAQIAYELGFKYPQHFIRLFKQRTGVTPNEYRSLN